MESDRYETYAGDVKIIVKQGDITEERTDAIVNSSNDKLDLSKGQVSQAISRAGGPTIQEECNKKGGLKNRLAVTTSGQLPCHHVIHVNILDMPDWREGIHIALKRAELMKLRSVAFPIGTGNISKEAKTGAANMFEAFVAFVTKAAPTSLKEIILVLYSSALMDEFKQSAIEYYKVPAVPDDQTNQLDTAIGQWMLAEGILGGATASDDTEQRDSLESLRRPAHRRQVTEGESLGHTALQNQPTTGRPISLHVAMAEMSLPSTWQEPLGVPRRPCEKMPLQDASEEYKNVERLVRQKGLKATYGNITSIDRIQNKLMYRQYGVQKADMDVKSPGRNNEVTAFHGTSKDAIDNICKHGFNRSYCGQNAVRFGQGVYFAAAATYSASSRYAVPDEDGLRYIFLCRVLVGDFAKGKESYIEPPLKSDGRTRYDSVVDDINNPTIYVVFRDFMAYPDYLITLKQ